MTEKRHATASAAAALLEDILKWKLQPFTPHPVVSAVRYDKDTIPGSDPSLLPFPTDTVETDRAQGVETPRGVDTWIELWASWLAWTLDTSAKTMSGAWLLQQLQEHPDLHPLPTPSRYADHPDMDAWAEGFLTEWDKFTSELSQLWWRLGHLTGNAPLRRALCPKCKTGWLQSQPNKDGFEDEARCSNHTCAATIDYSAEEYLNSFRAVMRAEDIPADRYLPFADIQIIWPNLKKNTLFKWVQRGQVDKTTRGYRLAQINQRVWGNPDMLVHQKGV